jgi:hypothetical protein
VPEIIDGDIYYHMPGIEIDDDLPGVEFHT